MRIIEDPIYGAGFMLQIGGDQNLLLKKYTFALGQPEYKKEFDPRKRGSFTAIDWHKGGAIWLADADNYGAMAHEAMHATAHIMRHMDIKLDENSEEVYTYYLEWLINQILKGEKRGTSIRNIRRKKAGRA